MIEVRSLRRPVLDRRTASLRKALCDVCKHDILITCSIIYRDSFACWFVLVSGG